MAEILSPGVFIEEVPSSAVTVQPVSTSTMGIIGGTQRGPTHEATLVTSFEQYSRIFGEQISESRTHLSVAAFYANGGKRAYVVRVPPSDAVSADADVRTKRYDERLIVGDNVTATFTQASSGAVPLATVIVPGTLNLRWRSSAAAPLATQTLRNRANTADVALVTSVQKYEGRVNPASIPAVDPWLPAISPSAALTLVYDKDGTSDETIALTAPVAPSLISVTTTGQGSVIRLDTVTGFISVEFAGTEVVASGFTGNLRLTFTPCTATRTATDNGSGTIVSAGVLSAGTVNYATGAWSITSEATFHVGNGVPLLATYQAQALDVEPISVGAWANDMRLDIAGNPDYYNVLTNSYTRFDLGVLLRNSATGVFDIVESFEELSFSDTTSAQYVADVVNDLSDLIRVTTPAVHAEAPGTLNGRVVTQVVGGGDDATGNRLVSLTLGTLPITPRSVVISYADLNGVARTITDNGAGSLVGNVDAAGTNTIGYTTGVVAVTLEFAANAGTLILVTYATTAEETVHSERFGDAAKRYTDSNSEVHYAAGTNGTYTNTTYYGRSQFTDLSQLAATYKGVYALDRVDENMQVVVPDFAGNAVISQDLMGYADARATQPSGGDRFVILTTPAGSSAQEAVDYVRYTLNQYTKFAAIYWPWVKLIDPKKGNREVVFPPLGHLAGIYARTDVTRNVGKAPGGTVDGALRYLTQLEMVPTQGERDTVYPNRINPLVSSPQTGLAVWGVRTLSLDSEWKYINARRLFMFVEKSIFNSTHWIVFENNGPQLWARIKAQIQGFLTTLFNDGMLAGTTPKQAFYVKVDNENNGEDSINAGQVIIDVGIAPNKPAEFVRFRLSQKSLSS